MIRKWAKRGTIAVLAVAICLVGLQVGLPLLSGSAWLNKRVVDKLTEATGREVGLGRLRLDLRGLAIEDFMLAKEGGLKTGTAVHVHHLNLKISWLNLLKGEVKIVSAQIDGLTLEAVRDRNGKLNLDFSSDSQDNTPPAETEDATALPVDITIEQLAFRKMHLLYRDEQQSFQVDLQDTDLALRGFSLDKPFDVRLTSSVILQINGQESIIPLGLAGQVDLAELDLPKARAEIKDLSLRLAQARLHTKAQVSNWADPVFSVQMTGKDFSEDVLQGFLKEVEPFSVSQFTFTAEGALAPQARTLQVDETTLSLPGLEVKGNGKGNWGRSTYSFTTQLKADLAELGENISYMKHYKPQGDVTLKAQGSEKKFTAQLQWSRGGARVPRVGDISEAELTLQADEQMNFKQGNGTLKLTGKLNEEPFRADLMLAQTPQKITVGLKALADRFVLPPAPPASPQSEQAAAPEKQSQQSAWPFAPADITADIQIGYLDVPYLNGKSLDFKTNLSGVTPSLKGAHGQFDFSIGNGVITDLYQLTTSNPLAKVLFLSLSVVGKVFNSLDVLSVLGGIAGIGNNSAADSSGEEVIQIVMGEDGEPVVIKVPASSRKVEGALSYDKFITGIEFNDGVATIQKGHFVSNMMSFNIKGTTDFNTEALNMTVHAAPGKHETDGIMPLTLKISGTVTQPQGSMSVMRSVTSLVKQGVTNNFASRAVKKSVGGFFGLFKKKEEESALETEIPTPEELSAGKNNADTTPGEEGTASPQ